MRNLALLLLDALRQSCRFANFVFGIAAASGNDVAGY